MPLMRMANVLLTGAVLLGTTAGLTAVSSTGTTSEPAGRTAQAPGPTADALGVPADVAPPTSPAGSGGPAARSGGRRDGGPRDGGPRDGGPRGGGSAGGTAEGASAPGKDGGPGAAPADGGAATAGAPAAELPVAPASRPVDGRAGGGLVYIGTTSGGFDQAVALTGGPLARHAYAEFSGNVPEAEMISVSAGGTKWRDVAAARPGTVLGDQIVRWARTIAARPGTLMLNYNHEPESDDRFTLGSAADFIAAWRNVRTIFDQQGATDIVWTWQMTAWSFAAKPDDVSSAAKWYPGDAWVDNVGADAYSWNGCGSNSSGYRELAQIGDPVLAFARAHGKTASFPEFGIHAVGGDRAAWLDNAHRYLVANRDVVTAAFYFNRGPTSRKNATCSFTLTDADEYAQLREMAQDTAHFRV